MHAPARPLLALLVAGLLVLATAAALPASATAPLGGPDVASYQHPGGRGIDWTAVHRDGQSLAIIKATEDTWYTNPYFRADWNAAGAAGLIRGAYHFARPALPLSTASDQARYFIGVVGTTREQGDMPPILDLEVTGGLNPTALVAWTHTFVDTVYALTGRETVIYASPDFWYSAMGNDTGFAADPLWIADYTGGGPLPSPLPGGWPSWTLWQYTDSARITGIADAADRSVFCCDSGSLAAFGDGRSAPIVARYLASGGPGGPLGLPLGPEYQAGGGWAQRYQGGQILYSPSTGAHLLTGPILSRYLADGGGSGPLGLPTTDVNAAPFAGRVTGFQSGRIYWGTRTGAHTVDPGVLAPYLAEGGPRSGDGYPAGEPVAIGTGTAQVFQGGRFYSASLGSYEVHGTILSRYLQMGGPAGVLGYPTSDQGSEQLGVAQRFMTGLITYVSALRQTYAL